MRRRTRGFAVAIHWGTAATRSENPTASAYEFRTQAEMNAFLRGVDEACGWMEYEVCESAACDTYAERAAVDDLVDIGGEGGA